MGPARETNRASGTAENTASNLEALIGVLQAPKVDLPTFKGDPMQYHIFMRAFDDNVERVISGPQLQVGAPRAVVHWGGGPSDPRMYPDAPGERIRWSATTAQRQIRR